MDFIHSSIIFRIYFLLFFVYFFCFSISCLFTLTFYIFIFIFFSSSFHWFANNVFIFFIFIFLLSISFHFFFVFWSHFIFHSILVVFHFIFLSILCVCVASSVRFFLQPSAIILTILCWVRTKLKQIWFYHTKKTRKRIFFFYRFAISWLCVRMCVFCFFILSSLLVIFVVRLCFISSYAIFIQMKANNTEHRMKNIKKEKQKKLFDTKQFIFFFCAVLHVHFNVGCLCAFFDNRRRNRTRVKRKKNCEQNMCKMNISFFNWSMNTISFNIMA